MAVRETTLIVTRLQVDFHDALLDELRRQLDVVRADPTPYLLYFDLLTSVKSLRQCEASESDMDDDDRAVLQQIEAVANDFWLDVYEVSLPVSFQNAGLLRKVVARRQVPAELSMKLNADLNDILGVFEKKCVALRDAIRDLTMARLFARSTRYDDVNIAGIAVVIFQQAHQAFLQMKKNLAVALVATMRRRLSVLIDMATIALFQIGRYEFDAADLIAVLKPTLSITCRSILDIVTKVDKNRSIIRRLSLNLYEALPLRVVRDVAWIIHNQESLESVD